MDSEYKRQVEELSKVWHAMFQASDYKAIESKFPRINRLSTTEIEIIRIISEKEDIIIRDILDIVKVPKSTFTNMINRLEKCGLINRLISDKDKRSYKLELTDDGKSVQKEHIEFERTVYGKIIMSLDTFEEREELLKLMRKIADNISKTNF